MNRTHNYSSANLTGLVRPDAQLYASAFNDTARQTAIRKAHLHPSMEVVVVGAGTVLMGKRLAGLVKTVHVVESYSANLTAARRKLAAHNNIQFHLGDGTALPFPAGSLDAVFSNLFLLTSPDPLAAIQEMLRVLKPGGRLVVTELGEQGIRGQGSGDRDQGSGIRDQETGVRDQGSGIRDQETGVRDQGSGNRRQAFERAELRTWLEQAGVVNLVIEGAEQDGYAPDAPADRCCAEPKPQPGLIVASGSRRVRARELVQAGYAARAESGGGCCGSTEPSEAATSCCTPVSVIPAEALLESVQIPAGYSVTDLASVPDEAAGISLGCGNPTALANLQPGETVLDIGSGGGIDVFLAARKVGPQGHVIGVDMTPAMLERARRAAEKAGLTNVEFRQGYAEALPAEDNSVDVIISNCVINLTEDKGLAWREAYRVLKPGGRVEVSDVATDISLPPHLRLDARGWAECVTGALPLAETVDLLKQAGFKDITTHPSPDAGSIEGVKVFSTYFSARKNNH